MHNTITRLLPTNFPAMDRKAIDTLQVNLGYRCNQRCLHCHVNAGPTRTEMMGRNTIELLLTVVDKLALNTVELTGGAPEMNTNFRHLVGSLRAKNIRVIDRCNLTILSEPGYGYLVEFLAHHQVEVCASLPCYSADNVDAQRGYGVFERSIWGLKKLNAMGYGKPGSGLLLNLVYNPTGATLPPDQSQLEADYHHELAERFGVVFNQLFAIANMPIQRFGSTLISRGQFDTYLALLKRAHLPENTESVMCRHQLSVDWQGFLFDCDFNQMLALPARLGVRQQPHLRDLLHHEAAGQAIVIADHCYGCTAGQGSSCSGSLVMDTPRLIASDITL